MPKSANFVTVLFGGLANNVVIKLILIARTATKNESLIHLYIETVTAAI